MRLTAAQPFVPWPERIAGFLRGLATGPTATGIWVASWNLIAVLSLSIFLSTGDFQSRAGSLASDALLICVLPVVLVLECLFPLPRLTSPWPGIVILVLVLVSSVVWGLVAAQIHRWVRRLTRKATPPTPAGESPVPP